MAFIKEYWDKKKELTQTAQNHAKNMEQIYRKEILQAVSKTKKYNPNYNETKPIQTGYIDIKVEPLDSVAAVLKYTKETEGKTAVLNFSSYKHPGGMFLQGSKAQEECLCHASFLYNVLSRMHDFYEWNNAHKNKALYLNCGLYSPNIAFFKDEAMVFCDVITCAAPNKSAAQKYCNVSDEENYDTLKSRIQFVLDIATDNQVDTLILGAYGCGVFGQNPKEVSEIFKEYLTTSHTCFKKAVFAIPDGKDGNYKMFLNTFNE